MISRGFRRGFRPPTTGSSCTSCTSYNIRRTFLPSVHIDGGGRSVFNIRRTFLPSVHIDGGDGLATAGDGGRAG